MTSVSHDRHEVTPAFPGTFINNVPLAEQDVRKDKVPVMFAERELAPSVWVPIASLGPAIRKGKNTIRIEFTPADPKLAYRAQLRWASVTDGETQKETANGVMATNQSGEGVEDKPSTGKSVFEHEFVADFAKDIAWHHYPPVTSVTDEDKRQLAALAKGRSDAFRPNDFAAVYKHLDGKEGLQIEAIKKMQCLEKAYAAGARLPAAAGPDQLEFVTTGQPEVIVTRKGGAALFGEIDPKTIERIKGDDMQMCAAMVLAVAYPDHLVVVRNSAGTWEVVY